MVADSQILPRTETEGTIAAEIMLARGLYHLPED